MVKKIISTYPKLNGIFGLGDYLRGSIFLLGYCILNNIEFDMDFCDHPIGQYFRKTNKYNIDKESIISLEKLDMNTTDISYEYLEKIILKYDNNDMFFSINSLIKKKLNQQEKDIIKSNIIPNDFLYNKIKEKLIQLNLVSKNYITIHVRLDDYYINNNNLNYGLYDIVKNELNKINNTSEKKLFLSSAQSLKNQVKNDFSNFIIDNNEIVHIGLNFDNDNIISSLIDFFLLVNSKKIYQISTYNFGSNFSNMASYLFDIPLEKIIIDDWQILFNKKRLILTKYDKIEKIRENKIDDVIVVKE